MGSKIKSFISIVLCVLVGISFSYLVMGTKDISSNSGRIITTPKVIDDYRKEMDNIGLQNKEVKDNIVNLEKKLENYKNDKGIDYKSIENELYNELIKYDIISGRVDVQGPGVELVMMDSDKVVEPEDDLDKYIIHNGDVLQVINELRFAGAEVIALNGYQLTGSSNIDCAGPVIHIDDFIAGVPFVIQAIGDVDKMMATLESPESYIEILRFRTINIRINEKDNIILKKN